MLCNARKRTQDTYFSWKRRGLPRCFWIHDLSTQQGGYVRATNLLYILLSNHKRNEQTYSTREVGSGEPRINLKALRRLVNVNKARVCCWKCSKDDVSLVGIANLHAVVWAVVMRHWPRWKHTDRIKGCAFSVWKSSDTRIPVNNFVKTRKYSWMYKITNMNTSFSCFIRVNNKCGLTLIISRLYFKNDL